jgi:hypothetical protein
MLVDTISRAADEEAHLIDEIKLLGLEIFHEKETD